VGMDKLKDKVKSMQQLADLFLKDDKKVYIKDYNGDYYFGDILLVGESTILISCFAPEQRKGQNFTIYWVTIDRFEEYKEESK
jgi:hypothetical protein